MKDVLFEFRRNGKAVKVSAIDAETGIEAAIVGSTAMSEHMLKMAALRRLEYVMRKKAQE